MEDVMISDKMELSALQLILMLDAFLEYALEEAAKNDGEIDTTVVARDFVAKKFREKMEKVESSNTMMSGQSLLTEHEEEGRRP